MARLRTPHCTTAVRLTGSIFRILLNLARVSVTPSACGMAPPDRPVPAPRATTGTSSAWQALQHRLHLLVGFGQGHHQRALAVGGQAVAFVGRGVLGCVEQGVGRQDGLQGSDHGLLTGSALLAFGRA